MKKLLMILPLVLVLCFTFGCQKQGEEAAEEKYTPRTGEGESMEANFKAIILLQRMADGTWLGTHCIWNSNDSLPTQQDNQ